MRFRGGGVGHSSSRAASDNFKNDQDDLDIISQPQTHPNTKEDDDIPVKEDVDMNLENLDGERDMDEVVDEEDQLSDSELVDYGYELPVESSSDEEGDEDCTTVGDGDY